MEHSGCSPPVKKRRRGRGRLFPAAGWGPRAAPVGLRVTPGSLQPHLCTQAGGRLSPLNPRTDTLSGVRHRCLGGSRMKSMKTPPGEPSSSHLGNGGAIQNQQAASSAQAPAAAHAAPGHVAEPPGLPASRDAFALSWGVGNDPLPEPEVVTLCGWALLHVRLFQDHGSHCRPLHSDRRVREDGCLAQPRSDGLGGAPGTAVSQARGHAELGCHLSPLVSMAAARKAT